MWFLYHLPLCSKAIASKTVSCNLSAYTGLVTHQWPVNLDSVDRTAGQVILITLPSEKQD